MMILRQEKHLSFLLFLSGFMDVYLWTLEIIISSASVSHTESNNMCIMSACSDMTALISRRKIKHIFVAIWFK